MHRQGFSTKNIEYFERDFLEHLGVINSSNLETSNLGNLRLFHLRGLPKFWETKNPGYLTKIMENIVAGLYEGEIPILFSAFGGQTGLEIIFGTWNTDPNKIENISEILQSSLQSSLHGLEIKQIPENRLQNKLDILPYTGLLTGTPSETTENQRETPDIDTLMRGISNTNCGLSIIAHPMKNTEINQLFSMTLNEIRIILESERHSGQENPTVRQYKNLLEKYLEKLQTSKSQGLWSSTIYLHA